LDLQILRLEPMIRRPGARAFADRVEDQLKATADRRLARHALRRFRRGEERGCIVREAREERGHVEILEARQKVRRGLLDLLLIARGTSSPHQ